MSQPATSPGPPAVIGARLGAAFHLPPTTGLDLFVSMLIKSGGLQVPDVREVGTEAARVVVALALALVEAADLQPRYSCFDEEPKDGEKIIEDAVIEVTKRLTEQQMVGALSGLHPLYRRYPARLQKLAGTVRSELRGDLRRVATAILAQWAFEHRQNFGRLDTEGLPGPGWSDEARLFGGPAIPPPPKNTPQIRF